MSFKNATRPAAASRRPLDDDDWDRIQALYAAGKLDNEIADEVGCASKTISRWRGREELPRNDRKRDNS